MRTPTIAKTRGSDPGWKWGFPFVFLVGSCSVLSGVHAQTDVTNSPANVAIGFPPDGVFITFGVRLQVRAVAVAPNDSISHVQLFDEFVTEFATGTNLISTITSPPYSGSIPSIAQGVHVLRAVSVGELGLMSTSAPVRVYSIQAPSDAGYLFSEPPDLSRVPAGTNLRVAVTAWETDGFDRPVELLMGTNSLGRFPTNDDDRLFADLMNGTNVIATFTEPPYTVVLSNVSTGAYFFCARSQTNATYRRRSMCAGTRLIVEPLLLREPAVTMLGGLQFGVAGSIVGKTNVIEASTDLLNWLPFKTNVPATNSFIFVDAEATNYQRRFYRAFFAQ